MPTSATRVLCQSLDLASGGRELVLDRDLDVHVAQGAHRFSSNLYAGNVVSRLSSTAPPTVKW